MSGKQHKRHRANGRQQGPAPVDGGVVFFDEHGEAAFTLAEHKVAQERASEDDRLWFEQYPQAKGRVRACIPGEMPDGHTCAHVLVRQIKPGVRMRQPLVPGWQPFTYLRVDPDTGELLETIS